MKLVSVVIPCYKDSSTLARAIDSVIKQTYKNIEIIIINDCSPETAEIELVLNQYHNVNYFKNPANMGLAATRNKGMELARGHIIAFLDADDEYLPEKIRLQVDALDENTVVTCAVVNVYPNGHNIDKARAMRIFNSPNSLIYRNTLNGAGLLGPKNLLLLHGGYDVTLRSCEDYDLWLRLLSVGVTVKDIGKPLYLYYFNPLGLSKNINEISKWELETIKRHAVRMGSIWQSTYHYASAIFFRLCVHLFRAELAKNEALRLQTVKNKLLLIEFTVIQTSFCTIAYLRLMLVPVFLIKLRNKLTSK